MKSRITFVTGVGDRDQLSKARLLLESIRAFAGRSADSRVLVYMFDPGNIPSADFPSDGVEIIDHKIHETIRGYPFAGKVSACADSEARMGSDGGALAWMSPDCLVIKPPQALALSSTCDVAFRPVHIRNVGLLTVDPLDEYWGGVYQVIGYDTDSGFMVESFVDQQNLKPYFNTHTFSVNPSLGLLQEWLQMFKQLVKDVAYQTRACREILPRIFLHQVILSTLVAARVPNERVRILPPAYIYPYNLHASVPPSRRAADLQDLVTIAYENRSLRPPDIDDIEISGELREWLTQKNPGR